MRIGPRGAWCLGWLGGLFVRCLGLTWRIRRTGEVVESYDGFVEVFLHGDILVMAHDFRDRKAVTMISTHRDGELIAQTARRLGIRAARGSATRGGAKAVLELVRKHPDVPWGLTPDGPRGPRGKVQEGVIQIAGLAGRKLRPHAIAASFAKRFSSWDRFLVPYPFSRVVHHVGEPIEVPEDLDRVGRQTIARELEACFERLAEKAEQQLTNW